MGKLIVLNRSPEMSFLSGEKSNIGDIIITKNNSSGLGDVPQVIDKPTDGMSWQTVIVLLGAFATISYIVYVLSSKRG